MKLKISKSTAKRAKARLKNKVRIRKKISGTAERPRLSVFRSLKRISAQLIDDVNGVTLASASSIGKRSNSQTICKEVGTEIAKKALAINISSVVFDRSGYIYHGKIKSLADGARETGLKF